MKNEINKLIKSFEGKVLVVGFKKDSSEIKTLEKRLQNVVILLYL